MDIEQLINRARNHYKVAQAHKLNDQTVQEMARMVADNRPSTVDQGPVIFFDASTRLTGMSLNAGFALVSSWSLALQGIPVVHFVCKSGMTSCVLGTDRREKPKPPPCIGCVKQSEVLFSHSDRVDFEFNMDEELEEAISGKSLDELCQLTYKDVPLGELVLPSLRWILRRHHLIEDFTTLRILKDYLRSVWCIVKQFRELIENRKPQAVVVFNGMQYPEAAARWAARQQNVRVISHEVGLQPFSAYFTEGDATAYDLNIPDEFILNDFQNTLLDKYLSNRFKGKFHMAGIKFWPDMSELDSAFLQLASQFEQVVPVFTNVIFDTSQPHANVLFEDMFTWLNHVFETARIHPETLFVIRAHPDEARKGKASEESVAEWAKAKQITQLSNIKFIPPEEFINSYDLIRMAKFVLIYNSTVGLEASILGATVLSAGKARYTASEVVLFPKSQEDYAETLEQLLANDRIVPPKHFKTNARRFLYWQLYRSSLLFDDFLEEDGVWPGYVKLKKFEWQSLLPENSTTLATISEGILKGGDFLLKEDAE